MSSQSRLKKEKRMRELNVTSIRAITNNTSLHYRAKRLFQGDHPVSIHAPHIQPSDLDALSHQHQHQHQHQFVINRAIGDAIALKLNFSNQTLHKALVPTDDIERLIFEMLEQFRVESLSPTTMSGLSNNLEHHFIFWSKQFSSSELIETRLGILLYTVAQVVRSRLTGNPVAVETEDLIEATRANIVPLIGHTLAGLKQHRHNQKAFARYALELANMVAELIHSEGSSDENEDDINDEDRSIKKSFALLLNFDEADEQAIAQVESGESKLFNQNDANYRIFTTAYDKEIAAETLVRKALLTEYRQLLDHTIQHQGINIRRLSKLLKKALAIQSRDGWQFGLEEGYIDGRRLSQIVTSPNERRLFSQEQHVMKTNSVVSFLIDCSGSMKQHTQSVTVMIDVMTRALDLANVPTEVLGFTTNSWNGGRAYKDWMSQRRPKHPGRLNEVCHMVFKDAETNWRRSRTNIAALLKQDLFREGIDGEAIHWACQRLLKRDENRRILIVISDGCPMDTSTNLCNDTFYLDNHLKHVVAHYESTKQVEILGLGVGLDLSPYYRRNIATDLSQSLDNQLFYDLINLIRNR